MTGLVPPPCEALVFDLDGTLVDSRGDIARACNAMLVDLGRAPLPLEAIMPLVGDGARALVARALGLGPDDPALDAAVATFRARYAEHPCDDTHLLPGAMAVLGLPVARALVTNKPRDITMLVLSELGIANRLPVVFGGGDGPLKPAPHGVLAVLAELEVDPGRAWMIGDGPQDILAGKAAGCFTVAVPGIAAREALLASKPDLHVETLDEVAALASRACVTGAAPPP